MTITVPVFGATAGLNVEPAVPGMRVILAQDADRYDDDPAAMEAAGEGPGTVVAIMADRPDSPLLIEWPSGARSFHRPAALVATGWPVPGDAPVGDASKHSPAKPDAIIDVEWDADGGISIGRVVGNGFSSLGFSLPQAEQIWVRLSALLTNVGDSGLVDPLLEWRHRAERAEQQLKHIAEEIHAEFPLADKTRPVADVAISLLRQAADAQGKPDGPLPASDVTEEDDYFTLGQELASIADRELRVAVAFLRGLNTLQLDAITPTRTHDATLRDGRGNVLTVGARVHRLSDGAEGSQVGVVVALMPDGLESPDEVSVRWGKGPDGPLLVTRPHKLVLV